LRRNRIRYARTRWIATIRTLAFQVCTHLCTGECIIRVCETRARSETPTRGGYYEPVATVRTAIKRTCKSKRLAGKMYTACKHRKAGKSFGPRDRRVQLQILPHDCGTKFRKSTRFRDLKFSSNAVGVTDELSCTRPNYWSYSNTPRKRKRYYSSIG